MVASRKLPKCICGQNEYSQDYCGDWIDNRGRLSFKIVDCQKCGLLRTLPVPRETTPDIKETMYRIENYELWQSFGRNLIDLIEKYKKGKSLRVLDVGCNVGIFVKLSKENGWNSIGIDIDKKAIEIGKKKFGVDLRNTSLKDAKFKEKEFDVVVLSHTLEHIYEPEELLKDILQVLKNEGVLVIEVPNIGGIPEKIQVCRGKQWYGYDPRHHVWHFTKKTLKLILKNSGYEILECNAKSPLYYKKTDNFSGQIRDLILRLSGFLGMADQITFVARPKIIRRARILPS